MPAGEHETKVTWYGLAAVLLPWTCPRFEGTAMKGDSPIFHVATSCRFVASSFPL